VAAVEGHKAFFEKRYDDAIDLFTRAESLVHAPPHLLFIARASEKLGRLVTARENYMRIVTENIAPGAPKAFHQAQDAAQAELPALEARIPYLTVKVKGTVKGEEVAVMVDEVRIAGALIGLPNPVDPGERVVSAVAKGKRAKARTITIAEAERQTIELELLPDASAVLPGEEQKPGEPSDPSPKPDAAPKGKAKPLAQPESADSSSGGLTYGSYAAFGVGALGIGAGVLFTLQSSSKRSEVEEICPGGACTNLGRAEAENVEALNADAGSLQTLATVGYIVGGVGVATGVTLYILGSGKENAGAAVTITPWVGVASAGVVGRF
jgi:hypothetical protein